MKSGSGASKSNNPYIYFQRLMFLEPTVTNKSTTTSLESNSMLEEDTECEDLQSAPTGSSTSAATSSNVNINKKFKMNPVDKQFMDIITKSIAAKEQRSAEIQKEDDDKLFCFSLYKELQKVPENGRLRTKIQILEVIQRNQEVYFPTHNQPAPHSYNSFPSRTFFPYGANQQQPHHRPPVQQDCYSGNFGYGGQSAVAAETPPSQSVLAGAALSPTDSIVSQVSSELSDIYNLWIIWYLQLIIMFYMLFKFLIV